MYIYTHLYVYAGTICIHMLSATVTFTQTHQCDITSKQGQGGKLGHGGLWKICWIQEFSCWSTHEVTPNEESCNSRTQGSPNMSCSSPKFIFQLPGLPGSGWEDEAKSNFLLTLVRCLILRSPAGGTQLSVKQVGYGWRVAFFLCRLFDFSINVLNYSLLFFCSLDPYSIGTTFQSCNLIWIHQSHIQRTTHVSIKFTVGEWKKLLSENEAKILFRLIPLVLQFSSSSCLQGHADGLWTFPGYATLDLACRAPFAVCWVRKTVLNVVKPC